MRSAVRCGRRGRSRSLDPVDGYPVNRHGHGIRFSAWAPNRPSVPKQRGLHTGPVHDIDPARVSGPSRCRSWASPPPSPPSINRSSRSICTSCPKEKAPARRPDARCPRRRRPSTNGLPCRDVVLRSALSLPRRPAPRLQARATCSRRARLPVAASRAPWVPRLSASRCRRRAARRSGC